MNNIWKLVAAASVTVALTAGGASAATISLSGVDYEMDTIGGSFFDNQTLLEQQVWWGNEDLALDFAAAWGASADLLVGSGSPIFGYDTVGTVILEVTQYLTITDSVSTFVVPQTSANTPYAIVTSSAPTPPISAVPLPASSLLLLAGLGGLAALRKRKTNA